MASTFVSSIQLASPKSAQELPSGLPNANQPITEVSYDLQPGDLADSTGKPVTGKLKLSAKITKPWQYMFGQFAQRSSAVDPNYSQTVGATYSQTEVQNLADQVAALSAAVGASKSGSAK